MRVQCDNAAFRLDIIEDETYQKAFVYDTCLRANIAKHCRFIWKHKGAYVSEVNSARMFTKYECMKVIHHAKAIDNTDKLTLTLHSIPYAQATID